MRVSDGVDSLRSSVKGFTKFAIVAAGFGGAFAIASAVVAVRVASTSGPVAQASSGMYAFGDLMLFVAVLGTVGVVPAAAALFFLRPYRKFWNVISVAGFGVAITGLAAIVLFALGRNAATSPLGAWAAFSVLRILVAPLLALAFLVCTIIAPQRVPRLMLLTSTVIEIVVSAYGAFVWFVPLALERLR